MSFPSSHIPANLTRLVFTGPYSHVPVNLGVVEDCPYMWRKQPSNAIDFDFTIAWVAVPSDSVDINFTCKDPVVVCDTLWEDTPGNVVPIKFNKPWVTYAGNQVPITFACEGGEQPDYTFFSGYIQTFDGSTFDFSLDVSWILRGYTGEELSFKLNDFEDTVYVNIYDGQHVGGAKKCITPYDTDLSVIPDLNSSDSVTATGNSGKIISSGSSSGVSGGNLVVSDVVEIDQQLEIEWRQNLPPSSWYDNDNTDAVARFELFLTDSYSNLSRPTFTWSYSDPSRVNTPPVITWWMPFGTGQDGEIRYKSSGTDLGTLAFKTATADIDLFDGTKSLRFVYTPAGNSIDLSVYVDAILVGEGSIPLEPTYKIAPVWHFHNYGRVSTYSVSDVQATSCDEFLTTFPLRGLFFQAFEGQTANAELATDMVFGFSHYTGETLAPIYLGSTVNIEDVVFADGEHTSLNLTDNPPWQIAAVAYVGEEVQLSLSTSATFAPTFYEGQYVAADLHTTLAPEMLALAYAGETSQVELSLSLNLGTVAVTVGESANVVSIDNDQFWSVYIGESATADIATETTLPAAGYVGESAVFDLDLRKSEGIGTLRAYDGQTLNVHVGVLKAVLLYPHYISARDEITCEFDISTSFELLNTACCPIKDSHERIELTHQPLPDEKYDGDKTVVTTELSTLPRFSFRFHDGANFTAIDPNYIGEIKFYDGHYPSLEFVDFEFVDFKLCYGNFVPDGDNAFVELISTYDDNCVADFMFHGEAATLEIQNNIQFSPRVYPGEHMACELYIEPIMSLICFTGEYSYISNHEFQIRMYDGPVATFDFFEPAWEFSAGETMVIDKLTTEYEVEFLERGCLDNQYVPSNENGDPDWDNYNPVPVELERFTHSILARCF